MERPSSFKLSPKVMAEARALGLVYGTGPLSPSCLSPIDETVIRYAEYWADEWFDTPDGKQWRLLIDGETIFSRQQQKPLTPSEREWLDNQAGAIVDVSRTDEKPMYYEDVEALDTAWEELQRTYGVEADTYTPA